MCFGTPILASARDMQRVMKYLAMVRSTLDTSTRWDPDAPNKRCSADNNTGRTYLPKPEPPRAVQTINYKQADELEGQYPDSPPHLDATCYQQSRPNETKYAMADWTNPSNYELVVTISADSLIKGHPKPN